MDIAGHDRRLGRAEGDYGYKVITRRLLWGLGCGKGGGIWRHADDDDSRVIVPLTNVRPSVGALAMGPMTDK